MCEQGKFCCLFQLHAGAAGWAGGPEGGPGEDSLRRELRAHSLRLDEDKQIRQAAE